MSVLVAYAQLQPWQEAILNPPVALTAEQELEQIREINRALPFADPIAPPKMATVYLVPAGAFDFERPTLADLQGAQITSLRFNEPGTVYHLGGITDPHTPFKPLFNGSTS